MYCTFMYLELLLSISGWFPPKEDRTARLRKINRNMVVGAERVDILSCRPGWAIISLTILSWDAHCWMSALTQ